ncbi:MAG TPA: hypothetical protein VHV79_10605 [Mycobacteriales bacterium]|jgi:hypothetical protein|nr:hypothetical protein [Mycobacteriales bacterium]
MTSRNVIRSGMTAGAIAVLSLAVAGVGIATAGNGGSLTLGHANAATKTTTIKDPKGTPLSLVGKKSKPPLTVNSSKQVPHLNASLLGGQSATGLATSGSGSSFGPDFDVALSKTNTAATFVVGTKPLQPGTYFVSASAGTVDQNINATFGSRCFVGETDDITTSFVLSGSDSRGAQTESEVAVVTLTKPTALSEYCYSTSDDDISVSSAGIFAIKVRHATIGPSLFG